jgi:hypothetical protein
MLGSLYSAASYKQYLISGRYGFFLMLVGGHIAGREGQVSLHHQLNQRCHAVLSLQVQATISALDSLLPPPPKPEVHATAVCGRCLAAEALVRLA